MGHGEEDKRKDLLQVLTSCFLVSPGLPTPQYYRGGKVSNLNSVPTLNLLLLFKRGDIISDVS